MIQLLSKQHLQFCCLASHISLIFPAFVLLKSTVGSQIDQTHLSKEKLKLINFSALSDLLSRVSGCSLHSKSSNSRMNFLWTCPKAKQVFSGN